MVVAHIDGSRPAHEGIGSGADRASSLQPLLPMRAGRQDFGWDGSLRGARCARFLAAASSGCVGWLCGLAGLSWCWCCAVLSCVSVVGLRLLRVQVAGWYQLCCGGFASVGVVSGCVPSAWETSLVFPWQRCRRWCQLLVWGRATVAGGG